MQRSSRIVVWFEEEWGDWLVRQRQADAAVSHSSRRARPRRPSRRLAQQTMGQVAEIAYSSTETAKDITT